MGTLQVKMRQKVNARRSAASAAAAGSTAVGEVTATGVPDRRRSVQSEDSGRRRSVIAAQVSLLREGSGESVAGSCSPTRRLLCIPPRLPSACVCCCHLLLQTQMSVVC